MSSVETIETDQQPTLKPLDKTKLITKIGFKTRNVSFEEYKNLFEKERRHLHIWALEENNKWIEKKFQEYHAAWIAVVDGVVIAFSDNLDDYPTDAHIMDICNRTNKFPFIFVNDAVLAIEETGYRWNETP